MSLLYCNTSFIRTFSLVGVSWDYCRCFDRIWCSLSTKLNVYKDVRCVLTFTVQTIDRLTGLVTSLHDQTRIGEVRVKVGYAVFHS